MSGYELWPLYGVLRGMVTTHRVRISPVVIVE
jgi:hypothetical protein